MASAIRKSRAAHCSAVSGARWQAAVRKAKAAMTSVRIENHLPMPAGRCSNGRSGAWVLGLSLARDQFISEIRLPIGAEVMSTVARCLLALLSVAWLIPISLAFFAVWDFEVRVLSPMVFLNDHSAVTTFHLVEYAWILYSIGAVWLASVIIGWSLHLTRRRATSGSR